MTVEQRGNAGRVRRDDGFGLVEMLVVVLIIGIIAGIAIPVYLNQRKKAVNASLLADINSVAKNIETYGLDHPDATFVGTVDPTTTASINDAIGATSEFRLRRGDGNRLAMRGGPAVGYCIRGYNPASDANDATYAAYWYDSLLGGMQPGTRASAPAGGACTAVGGPALMGF